MSEKLLFDYGHGGKDPGATYKGRKEADDVLRLGRAVRKHILDNYQGITIDETRTTNKTMSLRARSNMENKGSYDYFISFHRNAFKPEQAQGTETFTFTNRTRKARSMAKAINDSIVKQGFRNRGVKAANFHVLRETRTTSVLMEVGFIDNTKDNRLFDNKFNSLARDMGNAIAKELGLREKPKPSKPSTNKDGFYRVVAGSYKEKKNAENMMRELKKKGFDSFLAYYEK